MSQNNDDASALFGIVESLMPISAMALGYRVKMQEQGWAPEIAEATAALLLNECIRVIIRGSANAEK